MTISPDANVLLLGGPASLAPSERIVHVENPADTVKLLLGNRYEHFKPTPRTEQESGRDLRIFVWIGSTYVAE